MLPESESTDSPSPHMAANVPEMLRTRLGEEAHVRIGVHQAARALEEQVAIVHRLEKKGFPLAGLLRKITRKQEGPELRGARDEEKARRKTVRRLEEISRKIGAEVETLVDVHLSGLLPEYAVYRDARKRLQSWEQAITQFQIKVGKLVDLLGQARNMASSGYDKKKKTVSGTAKALIDRSVEASRAVGKLAEAANEAARNLGQVPEIKFEFRSDEIARLEKMESGVMQAEFEKIIAMFEGIQKNEVEAVKASGIGEAEVKRLQAASYLADYVAQLRQHSDLQPLRPAEIDAVVQKLEGRYLHR